MINHKLTYSRVAPESIEVTDTKVFVATEITPYSDTDENGNVFQGYSYYLTEYEKNDYISQLAAQNASLQNELLDTQAALCDIYEMMQGGLE